MATLIEEKRRTKNDDGRYLDDHPPIHRKICGVLEVLELKQKRTKKKGR